ncbi:OTU domain-containing protein 2 [Yarrowia sp. C11]|nr:OTU domain-containing protein 2 [Yarrowia sp. E02]KAG5365246.1 OTU domain-containing protein 2 [Yarrowia sp. C11]
MEDLLARHRKEKKDLAGELTTLKKQVSGDKKKKKEVTKQCEDKERELKERHEQEIADLEKGTNGNTAGTAESAENNDAESEDEFSPEKLLAQLELEKEQEEAASAGKKKKGPVAAEPQAAQQSSGPKPKKNRQKERAARKAAEQEAIRKQALEEAALQPDLRKIEMENIESLTKLNGTTVHDIVPDGHCLYSSIADQLAVRHEVGVDVQTLRSQCAAEIRRDKNSYIPFLFDEATMSIKDVEEYTKELEETAIWGGDLEILALARVYDCPISVLMSGRPVHRVNDEGAKEELKLVYYKHSYGLGEHYNSLRG